MTVPDIKQDDPVTGAQAVAIAHEVLQSFLGKRQGHSGTLAQASQTFSPKPKQPELASTV